VGEGSHLPVVRSRGRRFLPRAGKWSRRLALAWILVAAFGGVGGGVSAHAEDLARAQKLAAEGNRLYEEGHFAEAATAYQQALDAGLDHEIVLYNLGNAWFKQGRVGKAILFYRRVLRRNPRNRAAAANLERATALVKDEALKPLRLPLFLRPVAWVYGRLSLDEWTLLSLGWWWLLVTLAALRAWWRPPWLRGRGLLTAGGVVLLLSLAMTAVHVEKEWMRHEAVVVADEVDVRSGPGESYRLSFKIHAGLPVFVDRREGKWARIHLGGELVGWVPSGQVEEI